MTSNAFLGHIGIAMRLLLEALPSGPVAAKRSVASSVAPLQSIVHKLTVVRKRPAGCIWITEDALADDDRMRLVCAVKRDCPPIDEIAT